MDLAKMVPVGWNKTVADEFKKEYFIKLNEFLNHAETDKDIEIFPPENQIFNALELTPYDQVKVVIIGQDPYHDHGQAHGLCFSVNPGIKLPPSLRNIFKELDEDLAIPPNACGFLATWAQQGILMINTTLTVEAHKAASHSGKGWEEFTDSIIRKTNEKNTPVVFMLWGGHAHKKEPLINNPRHIIIKSAHPSPLSAYRGFFGSRPFSKINHALKQSGLTPIDWQLPNTQPELPLFQ
ncbi:MAG: uracil-DNA glycosylase [Victivallaceae bacterium]|nr:uracil-DNA glycosylase [Victivallaceae bacterium]